MKKQNDRPDELHRFRQAYELSEERTRALEQRILKEASRKNPHRDYHNILFQRFVPAAACMVLAAGGFLSIYRLTRPGDLPVRTEETQPAITETEPPVLTRPAIPATTPPVTTAPPPDTTTEQTETAAVTTSEPPRPESTEPVTQDTTFPPPSTTVPAETQTAAATTHTTTESITTGAVTTPAETAAATHTTTENTTTTGATTSTAPQTSAPETTSATGTTAVTFTTDERGNPCLPEGCISLEISGCKDTCTISSGDILLVEVRLNQPLPVIGMTLNIQAGKDMAFTPPPANGTPIPADTDLYPEYEPLIRRTEDSVTLVFADACNTTIQPCALLRFGIKITGDVKDGREYHFPADCTNGSQICVLIEDDIYEYNPDNAFTLCTLVGKAAE